MRQLAILYGLGGYVGFAAVAPYLVMFLEGVGVPTAVGAGGTGDPVGPAVAVDVGLLLLVALQHGVMARARFKRAWARLLPAALLRSTFVWTANLTFVLLFVAWRPLPQPVWRLDGAFVGGVLHALSAFGWLLAFATTFALGHLHLFGVAQSVAWARGRPVREPGLRVALFYRVVRHPLLLGILVALWSTPAMTLGRLVFAATMTGFVAIAIPLEERRLEAELGSEYREYRDRVPLLLPFRLPGRRGPRPA